MKLRDRYNNAKASYLTPAGRVTLLILIGMLTPLPVKFFPTSLHITSMAPGLGNIIIGNFMGIIIFLLIIVIFVVILGLIYGTIKWIFNGYFDATNYINFVINVCSHIGAIYKLLFGDYLNKWYFLKKIFRPKEVAKDLLLKD